MKSFIDRLIQQLLAIPSGIMMGDRIWAFIRLCLVIFFLLWFMCIGAVIFEQEILSRVIAEWRASDPSLQDTSQWILELCAIFSTWQSWRYLLMPLASLVGAIFLGARYIQDIYKIKSFRMVLHYFVATLFDIYYPSLVIEDGKFKLKPGEENALVLIGGPGNVAIRPGSVALFESLHNPSNICAEGTHFISRFEKIKEKGSLEEQHGFIEQMAAVTKDGVRVIARDIHFRYRIQPNRHLSINENLADMDPSPQDNPDGNYVRYRHALRGGRTPWVPYPYSVQAIRNVTYNRVVDSKGLVSWSDTVQKQFESEIKKYIRWNTLDQVTAPRAFGQSAGGFEMRKPREEIHQNYKRPEFRKKFREIGAELIWYGIGYFEVADNRVNDQRVETWRATWRGNARKMRAFSEARKTAYEEQGRAEARAEILLGIIEGLEAGGMTAEERIKKLPELFLLQISNLLDSFKNTNGHEKSQ